MNAWCGIGSKVAQLREMCGCSLNDAELEAVLKRKGYDVERAVEHLLDHPDETLPGPPSEMDRGQHCGAPDVDVGMLRRRMR
jgi:uncharacterized UBP type Zn finger protein